MINTIWVYIPLVKAIFIFQTWEIKKCTHSCLLWRQQLLSHLEISYIETCTCKVFCIRPIGLYLITGKPVRLAIHSTVHELLFNSAWRYFHLDLLHFYMILTFSDNTNKEEKSRISLVRLQKRQYTDTYVTCHGSFYPLQSVYCCVQQTDHVHSHGYVLHWQVRHVWIHMFSGSTIAINPPPILYCILSKGHVFINASVLILWHFPCI